VRLDFLAGEQLADRALDQLGETGVPGRQSMLARMICQKPHRPQFVRIAVLLGLVTGQRGQPSLACGVIVGSLPGCGRSSSAASGPEASGRSMQRSTV
jgi:hypothetical protein